MIILLTNDDGIFAPGLSAIYHELTKLGDVYIVAPAVEQSGVGHSITFRSPISVKDVYIHGNRWGWAVEGTPADCVKVGVNVICPRKPDVVISGINGGQNTGINILYSGTLGAAFESSFFGITSFAISVEDSARPDYSRAAQVGISLITQILEKHADAPATLYNINMSTAALKEEYPDVMIVPQDTNQYGEELERRVDTFNRVYYWSVPCGRKKHSEDAITDLDVLRQGKIAITPIQYDVTEYKTLQKMQSWNIQTTPSSLNEKNEASHPGIWMRTQHDCENHE